jgi:hypothetical protein
MNRIFVGCVLAFAGLFALASATQAGVPAYFNPGDLWTTMISTGARTGFVVANPNSGPGSFLDVAYDAYITAAQAKGIKVVGYVHTTYGARSQSDVLADIAAWYSFYPNIDGVFFDECSADPSGVPYIAGASAAVKAHNGMVVLNPGVYPAEGFLQHADVVLAFEDSFAAYTGASVPSYAANYPETMFYHVVHTASADQASQALDLAASRRAGYVFVTDAVMPNPYDTLPSYWSSEIGAMSLPAVPVPVAGEQLNKINSAATPASVDHADLIDHYGTASA